MIYTCYYCQEPLKEGKRSPPETIAAYSCDKHECQLLYYFFIDPSQVRWYAFVINLTKDISFHIDPLLSKIPYLRFGNPITNGGTIHNLHMDLLSLPLNDLIKHCQKIISLKVFL